MRSSGIIQVALNLVTGVLIKEQNRMHTRKSSHVKTGGGWSGPAPPQAKTLEEVQKGPLL